MTLALREPAIHPEGNAIHGLVEGTISSEMERSVRRVSFAASDNKVPCCEVVKFGQSDNWSDISASSAPKIAK